MTKIRVTMLMGAAVVAGALLLNQTFAAPGATTRPAVAPTRVAVCDIISVLTRCAENAEMSNEFNTLSRAVNEQAKLDEKKLREARRDLKALSLDVKPGTKDFEVKFQRVNNREIEFKIKHTANRTNIERQLYLATQSMYKKVTDMVAEVARLRGIDLVIYSNSGWMEARSVQELQQLISSKTVVYAAGQIDITADVLKRLDAAFALTKKGG